MVMPFFYYCYYGGKPTNGGIHGEKSAGVGSDRTIKMIPLYHTYTHITPHPPQPDREALTMLWKLVPEWSCTVPEINSSKV